MNMYLLIVEQIELMELKNFLVNEIELGQVLLNLSDDYVITDVKSLGEIEDSYRVLINKPNNLEYGGLN